MRAGYVRDIKISLVSQNLQDGIYIGIPADIPSSKLAILNNGFSEEMVTARIAHGKKVKHCNAYLI